jgi:hypothetical protein
MLATKDSGGSLCYQTLDVPSAVSFTYASGIDGNNIVGSYKGSTVAMYGFLYDGSTYTTIDYPLAISTWIYGIDGNNIVGSYKDSANVYHGFIASIPEPSSIILLTIGAFTLFGYCLYRKRVI